MLVDRSSLKVKLIDMGFTEEIELMENICVNPLCFMPPEEMMSDKLDASFDMWCLALTLIYFYLQDQLFEYDTIEETLAAIVKMFGEPHCSKNFFFWKRKIEKYEPELRLNSLDDLLEIRPATQDPIEREDLLSFIDFLKQMLVPTPQERITSAAALKHSFITMDHLSNFESSSPYVLEAHEAMRTYKFMTPQSLGSTSSSGNSSSVCSGNYASPTGNRVSFSSPKDETETILTPLGLLRTDSATFWSEFFSTNDLVFESETSKYLLKESLGLGGTAIITKFINQETGETVVIKLAIDKDNTDISEEKRILNKIKALGSENYNIVKFYEDFYYQKKQCLVFEKLDIDLEDFTEVIVGGGLHLCDIRLIAQQVLVALDFLHSNGIAHRDLKPDNIMLVDRSSLKVKLIDMGFTEEIELMENICVNPLCFMPPEEMMSDKLDASFDMWCLALTLIYFYLQDQLFEYDTIEETLAAIVKMFGEPHCSKNFFFWKRKIEKYEPELRLNSLDDLLEIRPATQDPIEREDLLSFIDFLKQMLVPTPQERITSAAALKHSFITMDHLSNFESSSPYVLEAHEAMRTYKFMTPQTKKHACVEKLDIDLEDFTGNFHGTCITKQDLYILSLSEALVSAPSVSGPTIQLKQITSLTSSN
ncbi:homeodomain-interacting protein kinase 1-like [Cyprinodon tularosa]|uniref:homeodomain-interacting protein kinase 1-like n=1 Tax=Cyprinodon tularosa TaxID=77115 RepID=UPI0018E263F6|nr:homeodomain-interacting protein kinase 1-like [Cyprinodon tularosa]